MTNVPIPARPRLSELRRRVGHFTRMYVYPAGYPRIVRAVRHGKLTYLREDALFDLYRLVKRIERRRIEGILIEAGCALGGSAIVLAAAKSKRRPLHVHNVFGMIPAPSTKDGANIHERYERIRSGESRGIGGDTYYGYLPDLLGTVRRNFEEHDLHPQQNAVRFVRGLFQHTLTGTELVALAHINGDWYASVMACLERIAPRLSPGGVLVIDDYYRWSGARKAVDEYFAGRTGFEFRRRARLQIVNRQAPRGSATPANAARSPHGTLSSHRRAGT